MMEHRTMQKVYFDRGARPLPKLNQGNVVRVQTKSSWEPGIIIQKDTHPRSYIVEMPQTGVIYRRNRRHLLQTQEEPPVGDVGNQEPDIQHMPNVIVYFTITRHIFYVL